MTRKETLDLIEMSMRALRGGLEATGNVTYDPDSGATEISALILRESIALGLRGFDVSQAELDALPDEGPVDPVDAKRIAFTWIHSAISIVGAAALLLESSRLPFEALAAGIEVEVVNVDPTH